MAQTQTGKKQNAARQNSQATRHEPGPTQASPPNAPRTQRSTCQLIRPTPSPSAPQTPTLGNVGKPSLFYLSDSFERQGMLMPDWLPRRGMMLLAEHAYQTRSSSRRDGTSLASTSSDVLRRPLHARHPCRIGDQDTGRAEKWAAWVTG